MSDSELENLKSSLHHQHKDDMQAALSILYVNRADLKSLLAEMKEQRVQTIECIIKTLKLDKELKEKHPVAIRSKLLYRRGLELKDKHQIFHNNAYVDSNLSFVFSASSAMTKSFATSYPKWNATRAFLTTERTNSKIADLPQPLFLLTIQMVFIGESRKRENRTKLRNGLPVLFEN